MTTRSIITSVVLLSAVLGCSGETRLSEPSAADADLSRVDPIDAPDSCLPEEDYLPAQGVCALDCGDLDDAACDSVAEALYGDFDAFLFDDFRGYEREQAAEAIGDDSFIARYTVNPDLSLTERVNHQPDDAPMFEEIWRSAVDILPHRVLIDNVGEFHIESDGVDELLAFVTQLDDDIERWVLSYDNADYDNNRDPEYIHTTIHEFAHLVFLQRSEVDLLSTSDCDAFAIDEGCSRPDSYLNLFFDAFWADIIDANRAAQASAMFDDDPSLQDDFYERYRDRFVSDYAATNPIEDAAEVFTHFVLTDRPVDPTSIADEKIAFLHSFPELTAMRRSIRARLYERERTR